MAKEKKDKKLIITVKYIGENGKPQTHTAKCDTHEIKGYALFCNLIVNNSLNAGVEFNINVENE